MNKSTILYFLILAITLYACSSDSDTPEPDCDGSLSLSVTSVRDSDCETASGQINLEASGGLGSYEFQLDGGGFQPSSTFNAVSTGTHQLTVRDVNNCIARETVEVNSGTVLGDVRSIIQTNCAIANCHNGDRASLPDYTIDSVIIEKASLIQTRTDDRSMPPPGTSTSLTDAQIALISCWVDDGANP